MRKLFAIVLVFAVVPFANSGVSLHEILSEEEINKKELFFSLPEALSDVDNCYRLCRGGQELSKAGEDLGRLINLQEINYSQNSLKSLPESFCQIKKVTWLSLSTNDLQLLPECLFELEYLRYLDISDNKNIDWYVYLPQVSKLLNLEYLDLSYNEIVVKSEYFEKLKKLKELSLYDNIIDQIEIEKLKKKLPDLKIMF